jgi:hypothetical protein
MKKKLILAFWAVGSGGAILWALFWFGGFVYGVIRAVQLHSVSRLLRCALVLLPVVLGIELARMGFATFREEKNSR